MMGNIEGGRGSIKREEKERKEKGRIPRSRSTTSIPGETSTSTVAIGEEKARAGCCTRAATISILLAPMGKMKQSWAKSWTTMRRMILRTDDVTNF